MSEKAQESTELYTWTPKESYVINRSMDTVREQILAEIGQLEEQAATIRAQLLTLREVLKRIDAARTDQKSRNVGMPKATRSQRGPQPKAGSIMEGIMKLLSDSTRGLRAQTILKELRANGFPDLVRTSLSPQLSRLKQRGYLKYEKGLWIALGEQLPLPYIVGEEK